MVDIMRFLTAETILEFTITKKTFEDNGLEIPTTWEEFTAVCDKLKEAGITPVGMHGKDPARVGHLFQAATVAWAPEWCGNYRKKLFPERQKLKETKNLKMYLKR